MFGRSDCRLLSSVEQAFVWRGQATSLMCKRYDPFFHEVEFDVFQVDWAAKEPFLYQSRFCKNETLWPRGTGHVQYTSEEMFALLGVAQGGRSSHGHRQDGNCRYFSSTKVWRIPASLVFPLSLCRAVTQSVPCPRDGLGLLRHAYRTRHPESPAQLCR